jgi:hypothetical protein
MYYAGENFFTSPRTQVNAIYTTVICRAKLATANRQWNYGVHDGMFKTARQAPILWIVDLPCGLYRSAMKTTAMTETEQKKGAESPLAKLGMMGDDL